MKIYHYLSGLGASLLMTITGLAQAQSDSTGLPGDDFSLQGALALFQKAASPEDFEKLLNSENNHVNNLDLNEDGKIDYIRVVDNTKNGAHALVLQALVSGSESQDIAVIEMEKTGDTTAVLQIVGDEDIYGEEVIIEPSETDGDDAFINNNIDHTVSRGPNVGMVNLNPRVVINVWLWPSVRFIYAPIYKPWTSPWRWQYYPALWRPWRPFAWHVWHPFHRPYYTHCTIVHTHRVAYAHGIYLPTRVTSVAVRTRHATAVGNYRVTKTRTNISGPGGHGTIKTRTTVTGSHGNSKTHSNTRRH